MRREAARLVEVGGDLGQEFVAGKSDRNGDADIALDFAGKPRQHFGGNHAVNALGSAEIEKRFIDRKRLDQRRQRLHRTTHLAADPDIFGHVRPDYGCGGTERERLEHRHRRANAVGAGDVAGGRHHAALAAADDHGLVGKLGIVALLDGGVERVAIDMGKRERRQRLVADQARRAAFAASPAATVQITEAVPAEAGRSFHDWCSDFGVRTHSTRDLLRTPKSQGAAANDIWRCGPEFEVPMLRLPRV